MEISRRPIFVFALYALAWNFACAQNSATDAPAYTPSTGQAGKDVVWVPTPPSLVDRMLDAADLAPGDYLIDLGSGDGRMVISAAKRGIRAHGIEFNPDMVQLSRRSARAEGVSERATFEEADIFEADFSRATVVTLFLLPQLNMRLRPALLKMKPGTRVISNAFTMEDWRPDETFEAEADCSAYCQAYKWVVPARVEGVWRLGDGELTLTQSFQVVQGTLRFGESSMPLQDARLHGASITFAAGDRIYTGQVSGNVMKGTTNAGSEWRADRLPR